MKKLIYFIIFFYVLLLSNNLFPMERDTHHLILGGKLPGNFTVRKDSPYIPLDDSGFGLGIGFYAEVIPFSYIAFESGLYIRAFNSGGIYYDEFQIPVIVKFRLPISDKFAMSIGGGMNYCIPFYGDIWITTAGQEEFDIPKDDLTRDLGLIAKMGFQIRPVVDKNIYINIDLGVEHVGKVIKIKQTDFVILFGIGFGLY